MHNFFSCAKEQSHRFSATVKTSSYGRMVVKSMIQAYPTKQVLADWAAFIPSFSVLMLITDQKSSCDKECTKQISNLNF